MYKIECVIQELTRNVSGKSVEIKIRGVEGYLLKQKDKEYNVFCIDPIPDKRHIGDANVAYADGILPVDALDENVIQILVQAKCANKKIRLEMEKMEKNDNGEMLPCTIQSISIL